MGKKWNNDFLSTFCAALNDIESDSPNAVDSGVEYSAIAALHDIESDSPNDVDSGVEYSAIAAIHDIESDSHNAVDSGVEYSAIAALHGIESDSPNAVDSGVEYSAIAALHDIESDSPNAVDSGVEYSAIAALDSADDDRIECDGKIDESDNDVPVFPNEFFSYIINLTLQSNVTMLRTINRVSKLFKELATPAMYNRCLHISDNVADALGLVYVENTASVRKLMRYACPGSGLAYRLRDILAGNTQWYNVWLTLSAGAFGWFRITDIYWRRRR